MATINAGDAMMKVLEAWGVKRIYGLPGGSLDSTMNSIYNWRDKISYVGVRHEEAGALAAVAESKLTGRISVRLVQRARARFTYSTDFTTRSWTTFPSSQSSGRFRPKI